MITLQNLGDSILFTFDENDKYLNNGTISVPMNSLILVTDDSDMATFRKAASNDIFVSALYSDFGMTKAELEEWYAENMVSEVTEEDVDEKIAEAVGEETNRAVSAETALSGAIDAVDAAYKAADSVISGAIDSIDSRLTEDEGVIGAGLNALNDSLSEKADISAVTEAIDAIDAAYKAADSVISGAVDNLSTALQNESQRAVSAETALSGAIDTKIDESAITSAVTSASTDSEIPTAKAVYDALQESGLDEDTEKLISGSLNDLNERKLDASAYTPTDLTNYYTKSETSGATEISTALNAKQDTLVSGTNIKTINNESILGSGNIDIQGGGSSYTAGSGINIDSANTISAVYGGWAGERVQNLDNISTPFYMFVADDCGGSQFFTVTFYINGIPTIVQFDVSAHTYTFIEGDSSWENYVAVEWDTTFRTFKATPNISMNVSDSSCARFSKLYFSGTTVNAIDGTLDRIESVKNSAIGNVEFGARDIYNDLYIYPSTLSGGYVSLRTVGLEGGLKAMASGNISTQMQSSDYKWISGVTIGDTETSIFNVPSSAITFNISRNPSEYLYAYDVNNNGYAFLDSNGDNPNPSDYSVVIDNGSVTVSALNTDKYITKIVDSQGELDQYVSDVQYWGYETDTIPNVVSNINDKLGGLSLVKLTRAEYDALATKDSNVLYIIVG